MKCVRGAALVILVQLVLCSAALADISVCNSFRIPVRVALAYQDDNGYHAAGWWAVDPNACRDIDFQFQGSTIYYTADSNLYKEGGKTVRDHWGNKKELFVPSKDFNFDRVDQARRDAKPAMFSSFSLTAEQKSKPVAITIRFTSGNTMISVKSKTAAATTASTDISVCNDFKARLRVALAYEADGSFHASGWWAINPKACRTVDFPFRGSILYYTADSDSYREGGKTLRDHWGNKKELYVSDRDFEFDHAGERRTNSRAAMFSLATISERLQSKPISITIRFTSGSTTISMKPK